MKTLIIGNGWLAGMLKEAIPDAVIFQGKIRADTALGNICDSVDPYDVVINTAAKTQIDWCEENKLECFDTNVTVAQKLALACEMRYVKYVFISSACIFESQDRQDVKFEDSVPNPKCFYALTKWMAEELVSAENPDSLIIRIRLPLSEKRHPRNTITKILGYANLNDSQESVTVMEDAIPVMLSLIRKNEKGIFHLINAGTVSPHEIGEAFHHHHNIWEKKTQDEYMRERGLAQRVTTYAGSKRISLLPHIGKRLPEIVKAYGKAN